LSEFLGLIYLPARHKRHSPKHQSWSGRAGRSPQIEICCSFCAQPSVANHRSSPGRSHRACPAGRSLCPQWELPISPLLHPGLACANAPTTIRWSDACWPAGSSNRDADSFVLTKPVLTEPLSLTARRSAASVRRGAFGPRRVGRRRHWSKCLMPDTADVQSGPFEPGFYARIRARHYRRPTTCPTGDIRRGINVLLALQSQLWASRGPFSRPREHETWPLPHRPRV